MMSITAAPAFAAAVATPFARCEGAIISAGTPTVAAISSECDVDFDALMDRVRHVAAALVATMPSDADVADQVIRAALDAGGLPGWSSLPMCEYVAISMLDEQRRSRRKQRRHSANATSGNTYMRLFGIGLDIAVLVDAFIVRAVRHP
jgi:hypothetical protein